MTREAAHQIRICRTAGVLTVLTAVLRAPCHAAPSLLRTSSRAGRMTAGASPVNALEVGGERPRAVGDWCEPQRKSKPRRWRLMSLASSWFAQRLLPDARRTRAAPEKNRNCGIVRQSTMSLPRAGGALPSRPMSARRLSTTILVILAAVTGAALSVGASGGSRFSAGRDRAAAGDRPA